jgi:hypothetical protein
VAADREGTRRKVVGSAGTDAGTPDLVADAAGWVALEAGLAGRAAGLTFAQFLARLT